MIHPSLRSGRDPGGGRREEFVDDLVAFAHDYARRTQDDFRLFVDAFRAGQIPGISSSGSHPVSQASSGGSLRAREG